MKDYKKITSDVSEYMAELRPMIPGTMRGFSSMAKGAKVAGELDPKTKELIVLGISVAERCDPCIGFHAKALVELEVTRQEIAETLGLAVYMGGGPSLMYAANALRAFDQFNETGVDSVISSKNVEAPRV